MASALAQGMALGFKCGQQAALAPYIAGTTPAIDGAFYLTTDTFRLYVGSNGKAVPVNQGILSVPNSAALTSVQGEVGQFYYIEDGNILVVRSGNQWIQINADTGISKVVNKLSDVVSNSIEVSTAVIDTKGAAQTAKVKFTGADGITVEAIEKNTAESISTVPELKLKGDPATLSVAAEGTKAKVSLSSAAGSASGDVVISIASGETAGVAVENGEIKITETDTTNAGLDASFPTEDADGTKNGIKIAVSDSKGTAVSDIIDPHFKLGADGVEVGFVEGIATLDAYSKGEIDSKFKVLNAMTYKGTVGVGGSAGTSISVNNNTDRVITGINGITSYAIGDTFLLGGDFSFKTSSTGVVKTYSKGSLLIAKGTEDENGAITAETLSFDVVEESADTDSTYKLVSTTQTAEGLFDTGYGVQIQDQADNITGGVVVRGKNVNKGASVSVEHSVSNANGGNREILSIVHDTVAQEADATIAKTITSVDNEVGLLSGIEIDATGHITGKEITTVRIPAPTLKNGAFTTAVDADSNIGTISQKIILSDSVDNAISTLTSGVDIKSDTFKITNADTTGGNQGLKNDMIWGSF